MGSKRPRREKSSNSNPRVDAAIEQIKEKLKLTSCHLIGSYVDGTMVSPAIVDLLVITEEDVARFATKCAKALNTKAHENTVMVEGDVCIKLIFSRGKTPLEVSTSLTEQIKALPTMVDAIKMAKLWVRQRLQGHALTGFLVSSLFCWMRQEGILDPLMSEMQMFRAFLNFFAAANKSLFDLNLLGKVWKGNLQQLAVDAKLALNTLDYDQDQLSRLLTVPDIPMAKFDLLFEMEADDNVCSLITRALGQRIRHLATIPGHLGVALDPTHCFALLEKCPPTMDKKEFRELWGSRSQTRRFRDGSIRECAVWEELADERHLIVPSMIEHLLKLHYPKIKCTHHTGLLDGILEKGSFTPTIEAFEDLARTLKGLEMPLRVSQCVPIGDGLRYASVYPPNLLDGHPPVSRQLKLQHFVDLSFLIGFEGSSRWPADPHALSLTRQAFACRIAKLLREELGIQSSPRTDGCLEILHQGHLFVGRIHYEKELEILRAHGSPQLKEHRWLHHVQPAVWRQLHTLHTRHILYGPTVRLAKRWTASQMIAINETAIELICAHLFLQPAGVPSSLEAAFIRFLALIADPPVSIVCRFDESEVSVPSKSDTMQIVTSIGLLPVLEVENAKEWQMQAKAALKALPKIVAYHELVNLLFTRSPDRFDLCLKLQNVYKLNGSMTKFIQEASGDATFQRTLPSLDLLERLATDLRLAYGKHATVHIDRYATDGAFIGIRSKDAELLGSIKQEYSDILIAE